MTSRPLDTLVTSTQKGVRRSDVRYVIVGAASFAVDAGMLFLLHGVAGWWLPLATGLAFGTSFLANFTFNRLWSFGVRKTVVKHFVRYAALVTANWVVTIGLVSMLAWSGVPYLWAKAICTGSLFIINFFVSKRWIYV